MTTSPDGTPGPAARSRTRWAGVPLRTRLVAIITVLLAAGLTIAGVTMATLLERYLVGQVDDQLGTQAVQLAQRTLGSLGGGPEEQVLPSDYYVRWSPTAGPSREWIRDETYATSGSPEVPAMTPDEVLASDGAPFTVPNDSGTSQWRVVVYPVWNASRTGVLGSVVVGLPLGGVQETIDRMTVLLVVSGLAVVLAGGLVGRAAVRRSLRPLREIEDTAAAIAEGDLSRRVPTAPPTTEVGRLGAALNGMLAQIEQAFAARTASEGRMRRFVADASHELRTPLAAIRGYGELYRMGALTTPEQVDDTMRRVEDSATRMGGLVEDLLHLARLDEGRPLRADAVDLTVLAADAVSDLRALDPGRPVRLEPLTDDGTGPCRVVGDESRLRQVVANLVGNVVQHTPSGTPVELAVGTVPDAAGTPRGVIEVRDHGPGIAPEHAARVFERFYRVDASRGRESGGAGLGMAIVAAIVGAHRGHVELLPTAGGGTTVRVELPLAGAADGAGPEPDDGPDDVPEADVADSSTGVRFRR